MRGGGPRIKAAPGSDRQLLLTSDPERYGDEAWWTAQNPALSMGSPTYGWLAAAFGSIDRLFAGRTRILISHRPSTLADADLRFELVDGVLRSFPVPHDA